MSARHMLASRERSPTLTCHVHSYYCVGGVLYSRVTWWIRFDSPGVSSGEKPSGRLNMAMESLFLFVGNTWKYICKWFVFHCDVSLLDLKEHLLGKTLSTHFFFNDHTVAFSGQILDGENRCSIATLNAQ